MQFSKGEFFKISSWKSFHFSWKCLGITIVSIFLKTFLRILKGKGHSNSENTGDGLEISYFEAIQFQEIVHRNLHPPTMGRSIIIKGWSLISFQLLTRLEINIISVATGCSYPWIIFALITGKPAPVYRFNY